MREKVKNILKNLFNAKLIDTAHTVLLFVITFGSILLEFLGYYLDAICGFLAVIAISTISLYLDRK